MNKILTLQDLYEKINGALRGTKLRNEHVKVEFHILSDEAILTPLNIREQEKITLSITVQHSDTENDGHATLSIILEDTPLI